MGNISFPHDEAEDRNGPVVLFSAVDDGRAIECVISFEALHTLGADYYFLLPTFIAHRGYIEQVAKKLIMNGRFEADGRILIKSQDMQSLRR